MLALLGRPESWNWLLLFHVLAAFLLAGGALTVVAVSLAALRRRTGEHVALLRGIAFWTSLSVVLPSFVAVYVLGSILADKEFGKDEPDWLDLAFSVTDVTLVAIVLLTLLQSWTLRRARTGLGGWPARLADGLSALVLLALVAVAVLMAAKPGS